MFSETHFKRQKVLSNLYITLVSFLIGISFLTVAYIFYGKARLQSNINSVRTIARTVEKAELDLSLALEVVLPENRKEEQLQEISQDPEYLIEMTLDDGRIPLILDDAMRRQIDFEGLKNINPDVFSWVYQEDTHIDYYVMEEQDSSYRAPFYIWRDIEGNKSKTGSALTYTYRYGPDAHRIVYAHHWSTGEPIMFTEHALFKDEDYGRAHPYVYMYYPDRVERYRVWAPASIKANHDIYTMPLNLDTDFYQHVLDDIEEKAYYTMGDKPSNKSNILVLSSCDRYGNQWVLGGRIVLVAVADAIYYYETKEGYQLNGTDFNFGRDL